MLMTSAFCPDSPSWPNLEVDLETVEQMETRKLEIKWEAYGLQHQLKRCRKLLEQCEGRKSIVLMAEMKVYTSQLCQLREEYEKNHCLPKLS